jgi:glycine/D-amino acid oxidase-like deaminating enzyme
MVSPPVDPVLPSTELPDRVDVVIIGGGIIGASAALTLAERGVSVALCEKGKVGGEQSSRNWGWVRKMGRDLREMPLAIEAHKLWERLPERTGVDVGFRRNGILYLCASQDDVAKREKWLEQVRPFQIDTRMLGADEVAKLLPGSSRRWAGALYTASDGCAEPQRATPAIANAAQRQGAHVLENCAVRGIETEAGRVSGVVTERGPIRCGQVILAGGAWSSLFCGNIGIRFPQLHILGCVLRTGPVEGAPVPAASFNDFAFRLRADGGYSVAQRAANVADIVPDSFRFFFEFLPTLIQDRHELRLRFGKRFFEQWKTPRHWALDRATPFEAVRTLDPEPSQSILDEGMRNLTRAFPMFQSAKTAGSWAGLMDATPDAVPVISAVPSQPGFFVASGFSGHGFGIGPGAGQLAADLVMGRTPIADPSPYRFERFLRA